MIGATKRNKKRNQKNGKKTKKNKKTKKTNNKKWQKQTWSVYDLWQRDKTTTWQNERNTCDHEHDKQNELTTRLSNNLTIRLTLQHIGAKRDKRDTTMPQILQYQERRLRIDDYE